LPSSVVTGISKIFLYLHGILSPFLFLNKNKNNKYVNFKRFKDAMLAEFG